jgi:hypothetical protein
VDGRRPAAARLYEDRGANATAIPAEARARMGSISLRSLTTRLSRCEGDDPDEIVDRVQKKTGQPRDQVEERVRKVLQRS